MIISIENIQASINHHWIMFLRYYDETDIIRCCQFCKNWALLTFIRGALCLLLFSSLKRYCGLY
jgi:hypothetical protein